MTKLEKIKRAAKEFGTIRYNYSGRGMFGDTCVGIVTDSPDDCIAAIGIQEVRIDNMGKSYIVYWPKIHGE